MYTYINILLFQIKPYFTYMLQTLSKLQIIIRKSCLIILLHGIELTEHMMDHVTEM